MFIMSTSLAAFQQLTGINAGEGPCTPPQLFLFHTCQTLTPQLEEALPQLTASPPAPAALRLQ